MPEVQPQKKLNDTEKLKESVTIPDPPANRCSWDQANAWFKLLTKDQMDCLQAYLYRVRPEIVRQQSDPSNPNYIDILLGESLNREYIVQQHGGGRYNLHVQCPGRKGTAKQIMIVTLDIPITEAEPILIYAEIDANARENRAYINKLIALGKITQDGKPMTPTQSTPGTQTVPEAMAKMQTDFMNIFMKMNDNQQRQLMEAATKKDELGGTVGAILVEKMKQDNPNGMLPLLIEMMKQQKSTAGDFTPMFTLVTSMFTQMAAMQQENTKMMLEVVKSQNSPKSNDEDDELGKGSIFDKMKLFMEFAKEIKGGKAAEKTTLETVMDGLQVVGPPLLETVGKYLQFAMMSKAPGMSAMPTGDPAMPSMPSALPSGSAPGDIYRNGPPKVVTMQPNQPTQPGQQPQQPTGVQLTSIQQVQQLIATQGPLIFQHLEESGAEFADLVVGMYGKLAWVTMSKFDEETMIAGAKLVPQFWQQVEATYGEVHLRKWIGEFKNYEQILDGQEQKETEDDS